MLASPLRQLLKPSGKTCFMSPERGFRRCPVRPQYILNPVKRAPAARGESLAAFDERCIPKPPQRGCRVGGPGASGVAPPSNTPGILSRRALPAGRLARLGATPDFHHGLLSGQTSRVKVTSGDAPATGRAARVAAAIVIETMRGNRRMALLRRP